jgi:hypothetical protein
VIAGLYTYAATALVALAVGFGGGWKTQGWRWDASEKQRIEAEAKERQKQLDRAHASSSVFEEKRTTNETKYRTVTVTLEKIIDRPVYLSACFDADGLRLLNEQISGNPNPGKLGLKLPGS